MLLLFFFNIFLALLWTVLFQSSRFADFLVGFLVAFVLLSIFERSYWRRGFASIRFVLNVIWQVIASSVGVAWVILQPRLSITPGIVAVPLEVTNDFEVAALASAITLTPGTLSVDVGRDRETDELVLFVHTLFTDDPQGVCQKIKNGFERNILEISGSIDNSEDDA